MQHGAHTQLSPVKGNVFSQPQTKKWRDEPCVAITRNATICLP